MLFQIARNSGTGNHSSLPLKIELLYSSDTEKGKPVERQGRKASGLRVYILGQRGRHTR